MGRGICTRWRRRLRAACARRDERGLTLLEIQITILLLGLTSTSFLGAIGMTATGSALVRERALADGEARRLADYVVAHAYVDCGGAGGGTYQNDVATEFGTAVQMTDARITGFRLTEVARWEQGATPTFSVTPPDAATCANQSLDHGLQEMTVEVTINNRVSRELTIVKRRETRG